MDNNHQKITKKSLLVFLKKQDLASLSTITEDNKPDAATIHYIINDDCNIYFLTKANTGKYKNILNNNEVVLLVTNAEKLETVKIKGKAYTLEEDPHTIMKVLTTLSHSANFVENVDKLLPILKRDGGQVVAMKIEPYEIRLSKYGQGILKEELVYFNGLTK